MSAVFPRERSARLAAQTDVINRARTALLSRALSKIACGHLEIVLPDGTRRSFGSAGQRPSAVLYVEDWRAIDRLFLGGDLGLAEAYVEGLWSTPDLAQVFDFLIANEAALLEHFSGSALLRLANRLRHGLNANTRRGSRSNISAHYDLGNAFYASWLDASMTYSAARFESPDLELETAQRAKNVEICHALGLKRGDHILEIGCGWGGFAELAARDFGARVHGVTLSENQLAFARRRIAQAGLQSTVEFSLTDYRDLKGRYDHIVSIEMFEAVGRAYWPRFFDMIRACLRDGGKAYLQIITIDDRKFDVYARTPDFIQRYIFPGGMLPSPALLNQQFTRGGLRLLDFRFDAQDYERTLSLWRQRFLKAWPAIAPLGFDDMFKRLWTYYLHYCEAGFRNHVLDLGRFVLSRAV